MATQKQVTVIATYYHKTNGKLNGTVTYLVRASNGVDTYCTTLIDGVASGCSCPARTKCYHKKQLEAREQERREVAAQFSAKQVPTWMVQLVKAGKLVAPVKKVKIAKVIEQAVSAQIPVKKDMMSAALTNNSGFRLMR